MTHPPPPYRSASGLRTRFAQLHREQPGSIASAPGRVNLIGEYLDLNGGSMLPFALPQRAFAAVGRRRDGLLHICSEQHPEPIQLELRALRPGGTAGWHSLAAGVAWAAAQEFDLRSGINLVLGSSVPVGAGLSSSAAICCAVAAALIGLCRESQALGPAVELAHRAETEFAGVPCGYMDQMASVHGSQGKLLWFRSDSLTFDLLPLDLAGLKVRLLVVDTGTRHRLSESEYGARAEECRRAARQLGIPALSRARPEQLPGLRDPLLQRRARHVVTEQVRVDAAVEALRADDLIRLGQLMVESHLSLAGDFEVSSPALDIAVGTALEMGALGARLTGAGYGGSVIVLAPAASRAAQPGELSARLGASGLRAHGVREVWPSDGARLER